MDQTYGLMKWLFIEILYEFEMIFISKHIYTHMLDTGRIQRNVHFDCKSIEWDYNFFLFSVKAKFFDCWL